MSNVFTRVVNRVHGRRTKKLGSFLDETLTRGSEAQEVYNGRPPTPQQGSLAPPPWQPDWCDECGVRVRPEYLKSLVKGTTMLFSDGNVGLPVFELVFYCREHVPPAALRLVLQNTKGEVLDDILYHVNDGWLQVVDEETGEERYTVSLDEYNHAFCTACGGLIEETLCQGCRPEPVSEKRDRKK